jgi:hypothetical protein
VISDLLENTDSSKGNSYQVGELVLVGGRVHHSAEVHPVKGLQGVDDDKPVGGLELLSIPC